MASNRGQQLLIPAKGAGAAAAAAAFSPFLDRFTSPAGAPSASRTATPGHGKWAFANPSAFEIIDGWLRKGNVIAEATWGDQRADATDDADAGIARVAGRTLTAVFAPEDRAADWAIGWVTGVAVTDPRTNGHTIVADGTGVVNVSQPGEKLGIPSGDNHVIRAQDYFLGVTLNDQGAVYWIATFAADTGGGMTGPLSIPQYPTARILFVTTEGTTTPLFPGYYPLGTAEAAKQYYNGHALDNVRVSDPSIWAGVADGLATFADRFTRADSTTAIGNGWVANLGTWGINGNRAYLQTLSGNSNASRVVAGSSDGIFVFDLDLPLATTWGYVTFRYTAAGTYLRFGNSGSATTWQLQRVVANVFDSTLVQSGAGVTWVAGVNRVVILASGPYYLFFVNGAALVTTWWQDVNNLNLTGTDVGIAALNAGTAASPKLDAVAYYPHTMTLPADLQAYADYTAPKTEGAATITDAFTAANGTTLAGRTTTTGGKTWTVQEGTWTINSNKVASNRSGECRAYVTADADDYWASVDVTMPAAWNATQTLFAGLVLAGVDDNNMLVAREVADQDDQPNDDEVEVVQWLAGLSAIEHKAQMGPDVYLLNGTYTIKVHKIGLLVRVFLDGKPRVSYVLPSALQAGRRVGLYQSIFDSGAVFDNFAVGPLS